MDHWKPVLVLLFINAALGFAGPTFEDEPRGRALESKATDPGYRLPKTIKPSEYTLTLTPYLDTNDSKKFTFDGSLTISVTVSEDTNRVVIHSKELDIKSVSISPSSPRITLNTNTTYDFLYLDLDRPLLPGNYGISFTFTGKLQDDMHGFYRSSYDQGDEIKWLGTTQFQPVHARRAFPCFDEPEFKAVFKLTINCPTGLSCYSNMRSTVTSDNVHKFDPTPPMSSYLLAFVVSEFVKAENDNDFSILARPEARGQGKFAYDIGRTLLANMENYTMIDYYTAHSNSSTIRMKMDQVAIPDFSAGAMENWGLLTYREAYLMIDNNQSSTRYKQQTTAILTHEITHMWFGDLVTCHWWGDTWLNEGFARFFQYFMTNKVSPGFGMADQFIVAQLHVALAADTSLNSLALTNPNTNSPAEVAERFGTISYNKGASIIRMMEHWLGETTLRNGLHRYLVNRTFDVAHPEHLFMYLQAAADSSGSIQNYSIPVRDVYESWTSKSGYPLLYVTMDANNMVHIRQERFVKEGETPNNATFMIPITYTTKSISNFTYTKPQFIMNCQTMHLFNNTNKDWIIMNIQQTGYYRVHYDNNLYNYIISYLESKDWEKVHEYNRAQLVDDAFNFAREGKMNYSRVFEIIQFLEKEKSYTPWSAAYASISWLRGRFYTFSNLTNDFEMHITKLMETVVKDLGFETSENELTNIFRTNTMNMACSLAHASCVNKSKELFGSWASNNTHIPPDHREFVYCNGLRYGSGSDYDKLWDKYLKEQLVNEKVIILGALGCTSDQRKVAHLLNHTIDVKTKIRDQDRMAAFNSALTGNRENLNTVWDFFSKNIVPIRHVYGSGNIKTMMSSMTARMSTDELSRFKDFVNGTTILNEDEKKSGLSSADSAERAIRWVETKEDDIRSWIDRKYNSSASVCASLVLVLVMAFVALFK